MSTKGKEEHKVKNLGMIPMWSREEAALARAAANNGKTDLYSFGDPIIDEYCGGGYGRKDGYEMVCVYGGTGMNKSTLASQMAISPASRGHKVAYLALEDEIEDVIIRMRKQVFLRESLAFAQTWKTVMENIDFFPENDGYSLQALVTVIDQLFDVYDVVLVDPIQFVFELSIVEYGESEFNRQRVFLNKLKGVVSKHGKTLVFVSHTNKNAYNRANKKQGLGLTQGSGQLDQIATKIVQIDRDENGLRTINLPKSRFTQERHVPLPISLSVENMRIVFQKEDGPQLGADQINKMRAEWSK